MELDLNNIRKEYTAADLQKGNVDANPLKQLETWLGQAIASELKEPTAMTLSTVNADGRPSARIVLLKDIDNGLVFYTNYNSRKGQDIEATQYGAITIYWDVLERQIRVEGRIERVSPEVSEAYFRSRPYKSQLGALVSHQSKILPNRHLLEIAMEDAAKQFPEGEVPMPNNWGGYRLLPDMFEFWQGRRSRLHDRITYKLTSDKNWQIERLYP